MTTPNATAPPGQSATVASTTAIDQAIEVVERLYQTLTGRPPPPRNGPQAPIPPEADAFGHVEQQFERLLGELNVTGGMAAVWAPQLAVWEAEDNIVLAIDLPGVARESVEVSATDNLLTVSGERSTPWTGGSSKLRVHLAEPVTGRFRRMVALPPRARVDQMSAQLQAGVLEIRIPLTPAASPPRRTVTVR